MQSLVTNLINPLIGLFVGRIGLSNLVLQVGDAKFKYGSFLNSVINFLIIAFVVFFIVKAVNKFTKKEEKEAPATLTEADYLKEIRDLLKEKEA